LIFRPKVRTKVLLIKKVLFNSYQEKMPRMIISQSSSLPMKKRKLRHCDWQSNTILSCDSTFVAANHKSDTDGTKAQSISNLIPAKSSSNHGLVRLIEAAEKELEHKVKFADQGKAATVHSVQRTRRKKKNMLFGQATPNHFDGLWWERYNELAQFKDSTGHCNVPQRYPANKALGKWVHKQRQEFKKIRNKEPSTLNLRRFEALRKIGFQCTTSNRAEALWHKRFNELVEYKSEFGHCNVPQKYTPNVALGKWVHRQRHEFKKIRDGETTFLTQNRIDALGKIGFQCTTFRIWQNQARQFHQQKPLQASIPNHIIGTTPMIRHRLY